MKILLVDNYDSFTYNLVHYLEGNGADVTVWRNDAIDFSKPDNFDGFVISPGPGLPDESGQLLDFIKRVTGQKPILGVCLGLQAITTHFGGTLYNQESVKHGVAETCKQVAPSILFADIPPEFKVGLYHSWAADQQNLPIELRVTAVSENGVIMAFEHVTLPVYGVQFHPESVLTEHGHLLIRNFLKAVEKK